MSTTGLKTTTQEELEKAITQLKAKKEVLNRKLLDFRRDAAIMRIKVAVTLTDMLSQDVPTVPEIRAVAELLARNAPVIVPREFPRPTPEERPEKEKPPPPPPEKKPPPEEKPPPPPPEKKPPPPPPPELDFGPFGIGDVIRVLPGMSSYRASTGVIDRIDQADNDTVYFFSSLPGDPNIDHNAARASERALVLVSRA